VLCLLIEEDAVNADTPAGTVWHTTMSLDGYIAGPGDTMDWAQGHGPAGPVAEEIRDATGAILAGRRWHDVAMERYGARAGIYGGQWNGPVLVLTHEPPSDPRIPASGSCPARSRTPSPQNAMLPRAAG
jgi:hypothetical protein